MPDRLLHGSDFPVPIGTWYALLRGMIDSDDRREAARIGNLLERDYFLKSRAGFAESHFTQIENVLRPWRVTASVIDSNEISSTASQ
jgi:hypothetical protein